MKEQFVEQKTVIILGMARSGTSLTAGILNIIGVNMGRKPEFTINNPRGSFEDKDFTKINNKILASIKDDYIFNPPTDEEILSQKNKFKKEIIKIIKNKNQSNVWGWKSPFTSLTKELFVSHLRNPHIIVIFRNPINSAKSIRNKWSKRGGEIHFLQALKLVSFYNESILRFTSKNPKLPVLYLAYEDIIRCPKQEAEKISNFVGLPISKEAEKKIKKFVIPINKIEIEKTKARILMKPSRFIKKCIKNPEKILYYTKKAIKNSIKL